MKIEEEYYQAVVIGGGITGVCAAITMARQGVKTVLVQDRPILGGNSSSEIAVPIGGADHLGCYRHARETGIIDELLIENAFFPNPSNAENSQGFSPSIWSTVLWAAIKKENIELYLNTVAKEPEMEGNKIKSILAEQYTTEKTWRIKGEIFIDCSGDGRVAFESGAKFMRGTEDRERYGESLAEEISSQFTMGNSIYIRARDAGYPVPFSPPEWAYIFENDDDFPGGWADCPHDIKLLTGYPGGYWWFEFGGMLNTIGDAEFIRDELMRYAIGVWDHIKNRGNHGADNYVLDWIGPLPGKRESRRFVGDHILTQSDLENLRVFDDAVAYGGWNIDLHYPHGITGKGLPYWHGIDLNGKYTIPLSALYSVNIDNLLFAGRNISVSHVALGSTRVMATCALLGQAVGNAAHLCIQHNATPREVRSRYIEELQQNLLRQDMYLPGLRNNDPNDLALQADVTASSQAKLVFPKPEEYKAADTILAQSFFAAKLEQIQLPLRNSGNSKMTVKIHVRSSRRIDLFYDTELLTTAEACLPPGDHWIAFDFSDLESDTERCWQIWIEPQPNLYWAYSESEPVAVNSAKADKDGFMRRMRGTYCLRLVPDSYCYSPRQVISGVTRPEGNTNVWISDKGFPQWLELRWKESVEFDTIRIVFDNNIDRPIRRIQDNQITPELIKDYEIYSELNGEWVKVITVKDNHWRACQHQLSRTTAKALRVVILSSNGIEEARVIEVRVDLKEN